MFKPGERCSHKCCDEPTNPFHDHFLDPGDCPDCGALRKEEADLSRRIIERSHRVVKGTTDGR